MGYTGIDLPPAEIRATADNPLSPAVQPVFTLPHCPLTQPAPKLCSQHPGVPSPSGSEMTLPPLWTWSFLLKLFFFFINTFALCEMKHLGLQHFSD